MVQLQKEIIDDVTVDVVIDGLPISFERRRYGRTFFCWAKFWDGKNWIGFGDPYPAANWKRADLERECSPEIVRVYRESFYKRNPEKQAAV